MAKQKHIDMHIAERIQSIGQTRKRKTFVFCGHCGAVPVKRSKALCFTCESTIFSPDKKESIAYYEAMLDALDEAEIEYTYQAQFSI